MRNVLEVVFALYVEEEAITAHQPVAAVAAVAVAAVAAVAAGTTKESAQSASVRESVRLRT